MYNKNQCPAKKADTSTGYQEQRPPIKLGASFRNHVPIAIKIGTIRPSAPAVIAIVKPSIKRNRQKKPAQGRRATLKGRQPQCPQQRGRGQEPPSCGHPVKSVSVVQMKT